DKRTNKFFHSTTNSKVISYYVLTQILSTINSLIETLEKLLSTNTVSALIDSYLLSQEGIELKSRALQDSNSTFKIPLWNLEPLVADLKNLLEKGIKELEDEIREFAQN
ncbi:MAG: hypothetical protein D6780_06265, partial [Candidatus Dadabacteria bacterium]